MPPTRRRAGPCSGFAPLFGLDPATHEGDRVTGRSRRCGSSLFVLPLFLFTPDVPRSATAASATRRGGLRQVRSTIADARRHAERRPLPLANMVYQDALVALFAFGGIYGAGVFGWRATSSASSASC